MAEGEKEMSQDLLIRATTAIARVELLVSQIHSHEADLREWLEGEGKESPDE